MPSDKKSCDAQIRDGREDNHPKGEEHHLPPLSPQLFPISHLFRGEERVRNGQDGNERDRIGRDGKESSDGELLSVELSLFHAILRGSTNRRSDVGLYQTILGGAGES